MSMANTFSQINLRRSMLVRHQVRPQGSAPAHQVPAVLKENTSECYLCFINRVLHSAGQRSRRLRPAGPLKAPVRAAGDRMVPHATSLCLPANKRHGARWLKRAESSFSVLAKEQRPGLAEVRHGNETSERCRAEEQRARREAGPFGARGGVARHTRAPRPLSGLFRPGPALKRRCRVGPRPAAKMAPGRRARTCPCGRLGARVG